MTFKVNVTALVEQDIYSAYEYIRIFAPDAATAWREALFAALFSLAELPTRCPTISESDELGLPIRHLLFGKRPNVYRIIFDIHFGIENEVRILRIWHGARDTLRITDLDSRE